VNACQTQCTGNAFEYCGKTVASGVNDLVLFQTTNSISGLAITTQQTSTVTGYNFIGCYSDPSGPALVSAFIGPKVTYSVSDCVSYCNTLTPPQKFAAVENGKYVKSHPKKVYLLDS
jgi:hypothetical protein